MAASAGCQAGMWCMWLVEVASISLPRLAATAAVFTPGSSQLEILVSGAKKSQAKIADEPQLLLPTSKEARQLEGILLYCPWSASHVLSMCAKWVQTDKSDK